MNWNKLKYFYYVAKSGSFTAAAQRLNLNQSTVSRSIHDLEEQLQTKLFLRNKRGVVLTKQGSILFDQTSKMLKESEKAKSLIRDEEGEPQGKLKIVSTSGFMALYISKIIPEFMRLYPKIQVSLQGSDIKPELDLREADILIHPHVADSPNLVQNPIMKVDLKMYASPEYLEDYGWPHTLEDLDHHQLIGYCDRNESAFPISNWILSAGASAGHVREPVAYINSTTVRAKVAEDGLGITLLPEKHPNLNKLNLVQVLPEVSGPVVDMYCIYSEQVKDSKRIQVFQEFLLDKFKGK